MTEKVIFVLERLEDICSKGENAGYQHFLLFPTMFSKAFFFKVVKDTIVWERVNTQFRLITTLKMKALENIEGKRENSGYQHFLLILPLNFPVYHRKILISWPSSIYLEQTRIFLLGKELKLSQTSPCFFVYAVQVLKTLWEKEELLVTSNFSFFYRVFYPFGEQSSIFIKFICKCFQFAGVLNCCCLGKS